MYPSLGSSNPMSQTTFKQHIPPSEAYHATLKIESPPRSWN